MSGTNAAGAVLWQERYTPYGITLDNAAANDDQAGYTGHIKDSDTGLVYMQARYYDPVIGRFYSNDPVGTIGHLQHNNPVHGFNRYAYANNNPYKYTDPDGEFAQMFLGALAGAIVETVAQGMAGKGFNGSKIVASAVMGGVSSGISVASKVTSLAINATTSAGESMIHDAIDGKAADMGKALTSAVTSVPGIGNGSTVGKMVGDAVETKVAAKVSQGAAETAGTVTGAGAAGLVKGAENKAKEMDEKNE